MISCTFYIMQYSVFTGDLVRHAHKHICIHRDIRICMYIDVHLYRYISLSCIHIHIHLQLHAHVCIHIPMSMCIYIYIFRGLRPEAGNAGSRGDLSHILSFVAHTCARLSPLQKLDLLKKRERERERERERDVYVYIYILYRGIGK